MTGGTTPTDGDATPDRPTVLIVEDERDMADLYRIWLEAQYDVVVAYDGESGVEALSEHVDVVLLDRRLPGMSGDEVLHALREEGYRIPVVMVTAVDPDTDIVHLPFDDYVTKPLTKDAMRGIVDRMLQLAEVGPAVRRYHSLERRRDVLRTASENRGITDTEAFERLTTRLESAARDAGAGLAWLKNEYYEIGRQ